MKTIFVFLTSTFLLISCSGEKSSKETSPADSVGHTIEVKPFNPAENMKEGTNEAFHANGKLKMKGDVVDGKRHGVWTTWYENGVKWSENNYSYGILEGKTVSYFPNGQVQYIGYYSNDIKTGIWMFYNEQGELVNEDNYTKK